jgi:hypothetical protein
VTASGTPYTAAIGLAIAGCLCQDRCGAREFGDAGGLR